MRADRARAALRRLWRGPAAAAPRPPLIAELERARDVAEAASAAKSRYLANVSHELRSPLNAIYGYAQLIERGSGVDPREAAKVIRRSAEHLTDLVEGLLDISLVENGVSRVASDIVRLPAFLDQLARMFAPAADAKGLSFDLDLPERLPEFVRTDQKRLRQVLINLISNAIKFTDAGSVTLRLRCTGEVTRFEVEDTGPGIAPADRERVFAPFERGEDADGRGSGFGLGLAITRAIVQILGGDIAIVDAPRGGAMFRVSLHLPQVRVAGAGKPDLGRIVGHAGPRRQILAVDDDVRQLSFVRQALEDAGFDVAVAPDGDTAIALCAARSFDLVLLDVQMGARNGWSTARHLRSVNGRALKIVMLSANAHERHGPAGDDEEQAHDQFLLKPVEIGELIDTIGRQLGLQWLREGAAPARAGDTGGGESGGGEGGGGAGGLPEAALAHVGRLRDLVRIGHVRGIEAEIRALEQAAPECAALAGTLYACLDRFDLAALSRKLEGL
ncbi:hybrid sensor histidine kinase/response regulator [Novosphingobium huizhouense]|uniref:hybrid sensor histidine kinase/response regulator n=1 Tax=Novosphingobium huizhouense TaxID=2866625 RepID=UPI001CD85E34|nr:hybrid sensor histidine kinase/response regulator [Novosphingobium huizhouense]